MSPDSSSGSLTRNTAMMAVRMFVTMGTTLYVSRVVLRQLGVEDFGVYSVVWGLALMSAFFNSSVVAASQRYLNVELGVRGERSLQEVFAACCVTVLIFVGIVLVGAETLGLWYMNEYLVVPPGRMHDAAVLYQMSLAVVALDMLRIPYNSLIVAYERFSFYAYVSFFEAALKLGVAMALTLAPGDKLLTYGCLLIGVSALNLAVYALYCRRRLPVVRFSLHSRAAKVCELLRFSGWNVLSSLSDVSYQQGSALVVNMFFGVTINATLGIMNQVKTAVFSFTRSLQTAGSPQMVKEFARGNQPAFSATFINISRLSYLFVLYFGMLLWVSGEYVLRLWLGELPPLAVPFLRLLIIFCLIDSLVGPLWTSMQAVGRIAVYQTVTSSVWLLCLPVTYIVFRAGMPSYSVYAVMIAINAALLGVRVWYLHRYCHIGVGTYMRDVVGRMALVTVVGAAAAIGASMLVAPGLSALLVAGAAQTVAIGVACFMLGVLPRSALHRRGRR